MGAPAVPQLITRWSSDGEDVRRNAGYSLAAVGQAAVPALEEAAAAERAETRGAAVDALGDMGLPAAIPSLIDALDDSEDWVVRHSLLALARLGAQAAEVVPRLSGCLRHENRYVRAKAALVLRRVGTEEATEALIEYLMTARWCPITTKDSQY